MDEVVCVAASKQQRAGITYATFEDTKWYAMSWSSHVDLFPWESRAIECLGLTKGSTVLLGAAGGGRELEALALDGVRVLAFEPSELFTSAQEVAANHESANVWRADYAELVHAANTGSGVLSELTAETFDAVILGWGSIGHVLDHADRLALLRATNRLAPDAPLMCSYLGEREPPTRRQASLRKQLRRLRPRMDAGLRFRADVGFYYAFQPGEIAVLAAEAGYGVEREDWDGFPYAILQPMTSAR